MSPEPSPQADSSPDAAAQDLAWMARIKQGDTDEWEVTLPIAPGVHRLAIRIDGDRWTTPPGVVPVADEFQGTVGVIVVR